MLAEQELTFADNIFVFETVMRVRNTEIDAGQHVTLEALTALLAEARARFLYSKGIQDINAERLHIIPNRCRGHTIEKHQSTHFMYGFS